MKGKIILLIGAIYLTMFGLVSTVSAQPVPSTRPTVGTEYDDSLLISSQDIGFRVPSLEQFMGFLIKFFFVLAGLLALFYMLWGAISWVTSGGDKDAVGKARDKIVAAVIGVILIIATLSIIAGLEQIVFKKRVCFGLTCELKLPTLLKCPDGGDPDPATGKCPGDADSGADSDGTLANGTTPSSEGQDGVVSEGSSASEGSANTAGDSVLGTGTSANTVDGTEASVELELPTTGL